MGRAIGGVALGTTDGRVKFPTAACLCSSLIIVLLAGVLSPALGAPIETERMPGPGMRVWTGNAFVTKPPEAVAGQVLVQVRAGTTEAELAEALQRQGGTVLRSIPQIGMYVVSLPDGVSVLEGQAQWAAEGVVDSAYPDLMAHRMLAPNDTLYSQQYHWPKTNAPAAWDVTTGNASTVIAVVDDGVDLGHPDLAAKMWVNVAEIPDNGVDDDGNGFIDDVNGWNFFDGTNDPNSEVVADDVGVSHGTHCAGLVGAVSNNATGVAGYDWSCRVMAVKIFPASGSAPYSVIIEGFVYAVDNGANVVSLSLGGGYSGAWDAPIAYAHGQDVVVVAAAGNEDWEFTDSEATWFSPVCNDGPGFGDNYVLGVAATDQNDQRADFSNYDGSSRNFVDVAAPGVDILSCYIDDPEYNLPAYGPMSGTSMACPIVAGLAGLVKDRHPSATADDVVTQIRLGCDNIDESNPGFEGKLGSGRINGLAALVDLPPAAPRTIAAVDTPGDEGQSITVTWSRSADDGRGFDDVVGYQVWRSTVGEGGPFTSVSGLLPPRTTVYVDAEVSIGSEYWYKVSVHDAASSSETRVVGPVSPLDDLAPDPITQLTARDTGGDSGGSITLSWTGYEPPSDFAEYRVYRATSSFTSINQTGVTRIDEEVLPAGSLTVPTTQGYIDTTVVDGTLYWYAVTAVDDTQPVGNEEPQVTSVGPVVSSPNFTFAYNAGYNLMAVGADTQEKDLAALLGIPAAELQLARWEPAAAAYRTYQDGSTDAFLQQGLGRAFWLKANSPVIVDIAGQPAPAGNTKVAFQPGWNMIGNPYTSDMSTVGATVDAAGRTDIGIAEAATLGWVRDYMWAYDTYRRSYALVSPTIDFADQIIRKGAGVFFHAFVPGQLTMPRPDAAAAPTAAEAAPSITADWKLRIVAESGAGADVDNFVGVSSSRAKLNAIASPPVRGLDFYFVDDSGAHAAARFAAPGTTAATYTARVVVDEAGPVTLRWPDLSELPADVRPILVDLAAGKRMYMRTTGSYTFDATVEAQRQFQVVLNADAAGALLVQTLAATPAAAGAQVAFTLNQDAAVTVEVLNVAGRCIRTLATATPVAAAQVNTLIWDGSSALGTKVPAGRYLVRVVAQTQDGQQASAMSALSLRR